MRNILLLALLGMFLAAPALTMPAMAMIAPSLGQTCVIVSNNPLNDTMNKCPRDYTDGTNGFVSARLPAASTATDPVCAWGTCVYLHNTGNKDYFVPFATKQDWDAFLANAPSDVIVEGNGCVAQIVTTKCGETIGLNPMRDGQWEIVGTQVQETYSCVGGQIELTQASLAACNPNGAPTTTALIEPGMARIQGWREDIQ